MLSGINSEWDKVLRPTPMKLTFRRRQTIKAETKQHRYFNIHRIVQPSLKSVWEIFTTMPITIVVHVAPSAQNSLLFLFTWLISLCPSSSTHYHFPREADRRKIGPDQSPLTEQWTSLVKHTHHNYNAIFVCVTI